MRTWIKKQQSNHCSIGDVVSNSTFLIPEIHMKLFSERLRKHDGNLNSYLSFLLNRYRFLIRNGFLPKHEYLKTAYQEKHQNLKRIDFVPLAEDWAELKCLRVFLNRSMNWIFVALLLLDSLDLEENLPKNLASFVVPKITNFRLEVKAILSRKQLVYERILQMTRDRAGKKLQK